MNNAYKSQKTYLAKEGKIFGPYSPLEIEGLRSSGSIRQYTWIWADGWLPIDPAPVQSPKRQNPAIMKMDAKLSAVCHDHKNAAYGVVQSITELGCELFASRQNVPVHFQKNSRLQMNLVNEKTHQAVNVEAVFIGVNNAEDGWHYVFKWNAVPHL